MDIFQFILTELPYTGFDYGPIYNSLFWLGLSIWSLVVAAVFLKNKTTIAKIFSSMAKAFLVRRREEEIQIVDHNDTPADPVILQERVIRYNPLADVQAPTTAQVQSTVSSNSDMIVDDSTRKFVEDIVKEELIISREGESQDEFSQDDFNTADFDGVNPDVYWQPREDIVLPVEEKVSKRVEEIIIQTGQETQKIEEQTEAIDIKKVFSDEIILDKDGEYPKMILNRTKIE